MHGEPQKEHLWLQQLLGAWTYEGEGFAGPDQPPEKMSGSETVRTLGGLWIQIEGRAPGPGGAEMSSIITLGYDPAKQSYVGSFIASVMTMMWLYEGQLDESGKVLTLDARGPVFGVEGKWADYQDIVTIVDRDHWRLSSQVKGDDGKWTQFMSSEHRRVKT